MTKIGKRPFELVKLQKGSSPQQQPPPPHMQQPPYPPQLLHQQQQPQPQPLKPPRNFISMKKPPGPGQLTPSVSIAPVMKKPVQHSRPPSDSDSENEEFKYQKPLPKAKRKTFFLS